MQPRNIYDALAYLTECTLATVTDLKMKKSASKSETARQIRIAQIGVDWCNSEKVNTDAIHASRVTEVTSKYNSRVESWAEQFKQ